MGWFLADIYDMLGGMGWETQLEDEAMLGGIGWETQLKDEANGGTYPTGSHW